MHGLSTLPSSKVFPIAIFLTILLSQSDRVVASFPDPVWNEYYPLAQANQWTYRVNKNGMRSRVTWKVVNESSNRDGKVFALWPFPSPSDDVGMQLQVTTHGLKKLSQDFYVLRFPVTPGKSWEAGNVRVFKVVAEGNPCSGGKFKFERCAIVQDDDADIKLRTVTTYALGVGPVRYNYYKMTGGEVAIAPIQTMELVSYTVAGGSAKK